jgi:hypothetical protein
MPEKGYSIIMTAMYHLTIELPQAVKSLLPDAEDEAKRLLALRIMTHGAWLNHGASPVSVLPAFWCWQNGRG